jgi:thiol:disulfide interchange protein
MKSESGNREWLDEFMSLKQVDPNNPFTVPPGYFDESEQQIISAIKLEELKSDKGFTVPENYFDELSNNIQSRINLEELKSKEDFTVPQNYFDELSSNIQSRINLEELKSGEEFTVPQNYFDELSSNIQSRINIEEYVNNDAHGHAVPQDYFNAFEQQINARILIEETVSAEQNFSVPADYFDKLNNAILNKTVKQNVAKRKGIVRRMYATNTFKYAAAACFAVFLGTGLLLSRLSAPANDHNNSFLHKQLSAVSTSDIQSYLQNDVDANDTQHTVIDENTPVNTNSLTNALQGNADDTNN